MSQPVALQPRQDSQIVRPTRTGSDRLEIVVGGETFALQHHKGETDDQLYVWAQERKVLAVADYYQGFLPNAGNGNRAQRYVKEWAVGLREVAELKAAFLTPAHGDAIAGSAAIHKELSILAEALESICNQTIMGLYKGIRKDLLVVSIALPDRLANQYSLREQYVTTKDISKMIIKRYTGWWGDIPSHWSPAPIASHSKLITVLAGGTQALVDSTREVLVTDLVLASHMPERAYLANPYNPLSQQLIIDVY
ncbi:MAG: alkyl sulfatase BDS1-like metallo-beta-lactamase superfamily hydrolase [Pseudomonadales bacterium]|jgi:alkyl sulfatase BDS1-like metallo-beta-lactamase superfamily hydrolase